MNNDPSSSSSSHPPPNDDQISPEEAAAAASEDGNEQQQRKSRLQRDQKATFLDNLIRNIDIMIYCELSILYYMDISFIRFLIRALPQWFYFTPKPAMFPLPPPAARPYIGAIFTTNLICLLLHLLTSPPAGGEATHGYLHGGVLMDFVGQESPVSKIRLLLLDILTLALQLVILAVVLERRKLGTDSSATGAANPSIQPQPQDHDSEERGIYRTSSTSAEDIELQTFSSGRTGADEDRERNELSSPSSSHFQDDGTLAAVDEHPLDPFHSGQHIIADLSILDTIRAQWMQYGSLASAASEAGAEGREAMDEVTVRRRIGFRIGGLEIRGRFRV